MPIPNSMGGKLRRFYPAICGRPAGWGSNIAFTPNLSRLAEGPATVSYPQYRAQNLSRRQ